MRTKRPAAFNVGIEIDADVRKQWRTVEIPNFTLEIDALTYLADLSNEIARAREMLPDFGADYLVYADPPYLMDVRSSKQKIYKHEFETPRLHAALLDILRSLPCMVMISGYDSDLYNSGLHEWRKVQFTGISRGGPTIETVWLNFEEPAELHDYRFLGNNKRERQDIKRQKMRWIRRLETMPAQKRYAMLSAIAEYKRSMAGEDTGPSSRRQKRPPSTDADRSTNKT